MNLHKKFCIGFSLNLEPYEWNKLFKNYGEYIYEIYFAPAIDDDRFHLHSDIREQMRDPKLATKLTLSMIELAKEYGIRTNMVLNTTLDADSDIVWKAKDWCMENGIKPDGLTVMDHLYMDALMAFDVDTEFTYSYNNNITRRDFLNRAEGNYEFVVVGNRSIRDINIFKAINDDGAEIELLLNNGCSHNCKWCSTRKSEFCDDIVDKNIKKYGLLYLMALQSVYPFEMRDYYDNMIFSENKTTTITTEDGKVITKHKIGVQKTRIGVSLYKLSTRQFYNYWDFKKSLDIYINNVTPRSIDSFYHTCTLTRLLKYVDEHEFTNKDWKEIVKIKKALWKEALQK